MKGTGLRVKGTDPFSQFAIPEGCVRSKSHGRAAEKRPLLQGLKKGPGNASAWRESPDGSNKFLSATSGLKKPRLRSGQKGCS